MVYFFVKCILSGLIIAVVSEVARRSPSVGALIVSWPLCRSSAFSGFGTGDVGGIADHAQSTFWYVLPSLPMFLVLPAMLRAGVGFWSSLGANCLLTMLLYLAMAWGLAKFGISL